MDIQQIRNVGIIAHGGAGKTTLAEALLFNAKAVDRLGKVDDGSSNFDYDPEEIRKKITISTSFHHYNWNKVEVTLADTPGYINFEADTRACLRLLDGAILVVNAVSGVDSWPTVMPGWDRRPWTKYDDLISTGSTPELFEDR